MCDPLKADGVTKGLYGLCIAYCEAQDLDAFDKTNALEDSVPGDWLLANYDLRRTADDPDMPCLVSPSVCPCFNTELCRTFSDYECPIENIVNVPCTGHGVLSGGNGADLALDWIQSVLNGQQ